MKCGNGTIIDGDASNNSAASVLRVCVCHQLKEMAQ